MCDLHHNTLSHPTPRGAIVRQIQYAKSASPVTPWIKLYNSGNFFDPVSIPVCDYDAIALECQHHQRVVVENHPRFGRTRHQAFAERLPGRLEIAVGLESVQPRLLRRLGKQMTRDDFDRYARDLFNWKIDLRVFLIVGAPGISISEASRWARLSVRYAASKNARHISLIPARQGNGWNGRAGSLPQIGVSELAEIYAASIDELASPTCLSVDLWEFDQQRLNDKEFASLERLASAIQRQDSRI